MKRKIIRYFDSNWDFVKDKILKVLSEIIKEKTINVVSEQLSQYPFLKIRGEEYRVANIVKRELDKTKIAYDVFARIEERPNIIASLGRNESGKRLMVAAHMDVVPPGDGWDTDPFEMTMKGKFVYGRGVLDNKGPLAATLVALNVLKEIHGDKAIAGQFQAAFLSDEEAHDPDGVDYGIGYLLQDRLINPTMAIIPDIGENMKRVCIAEKGPNTIKVSAFGKQAHGSTPERGVNAVYMMAKLVREIEMMKLPFTPHPQLGGPTINLGQIWGGVAPNVVPGACSIMLDIRTIPGMASTLLIEQIQACCQRVGGNFKIESISSALPHEISPNNELTRIIQKNCQEMLGILPEPFGMGGATFAKMLNLAGVTAVGWGPGDDDAFHMINEYVEISQLVDFCKIICLVAVDLLS